MTETIARGRSLRAVAREVPGARALVNLARKAARRVTGTADVSSAVVAVVKRHGQRTPRRGEIMAALAQSGSPEIISAARHLLENKKMLPFFADQPALIRRGNYAERLAFSAMSRCIHREALEERARAAQLLTSAGTPLSEVRIDPAAGFAVVEAGAWLPVLDALDEAKVCLSRARPGGPVNPGKVSIQPIPPPRPLLSSSLMALAKHSAVLRVVADYLGGLPILIRINLLHSANDAMQAGSSQFYHIDPEDFRQVKVFLAISPIYESSGPLHLIRAEDSERLQVRWNYRLNKPRLADEAVTGTGVRPTLFTGPEGMIVFADTSRCFHMGSRPGSHPRFVAMFQYVTPAAPLLPLGETALKTKHSAAAESARVKSKQEQLLFGLRR